MTSTYAPSRVAVALLATVALALALVLAPIAPARSADAEGDRPRPLMLDVTGWQRTSAPLPDAGDGIGPGSYLLIEMSDGTYICTSNFLWRDSGGTTYLGAAGHCFLPASATKAVGSNPYVKKLEVCYADCAFGGQLGAVLNGQFATLGQVVYARQNADGDTDDQIGKDFGMAVVPSALSSLLRPEVPVWGGPTGSADGRVGAVCLYGNGVGVGETFTTKARTGTASQLIGLDDGGGDGWTAEIVINGGDSGSAITYCAPSTSGLSGTDALGVVTHGLIVPSLAFGTTVAEAKAMVLRDWNKAIELVLPGTTPPPPSGSNTAPTASFTKACSGATCTFDASGSTDADGSITEYAWDFGDGTVGSGQSVSHRYGGKRSQTYTVRLTVRDDDGATAAATAPVECSGSGKNRSCS